MVLTLLIITSGLLQTPSAKTVTVDVQARVAEIDTGKLKGEPTELAWSEDGTKLFLQTSERDARGMVINPRYFVMAAADGKPEPVAAKPEWESGYWTWKSNKYAPGSKTWGIDIKEDQRMAAATASPMGGSLAKGGTSASATGSTVEEATTQANQTQHLHVFTLTLKGETVGEFINQQFLPGYTFGWSPERLGMIAYANQSGHLALMDQQGQKQQIEATKNVLLPAWSADGTKIAFLQRAGKNKYDLFIANLRQ